MFFHWKHWFSNGFICFFIENIGFLLVLLFFLLKPLVFYCFNYFNIHFGTDLLMKLYWNWYRNGPGAPEPFLYGFAYEFVLKLLQKWTWSSGALFGQICLWIYIEIGTEMELDLQSHLLTDLLMNLYGNWYINGPGAPGHFCMDLHMNFYWNCYRNGHVRVHVYVHAHVHVHVFVHVHAHVHVHVHVQGQLCIILYINSWKDLSQNGSGAPSPLLYQFSYKFMSKYAQKWLWSSKPMFVSNFV